MTALLYPKATWRPISSHGGALTADRGLIEHIVTNDFSPYGFFAAPKNGASSHLWIALDGTVEQYIDLRMRSWAQAGGNAAWASAEIAGKTGTLKTPAQCQALAELLAWGHQHPDLRWALTPTDDPNGEGVGWHGMGAHAVPTWGHPYCPGPQRVTQTRTTVLPLARRLAAPPTPPTPTKDDDMSPDQAAQMQRIEDKLDALAAPRTPDHADPDTRHSSIGDVLTRLDALEKVLAPKP